MTPDVVLVCGVGGVGKTTLAAALGVAHARAGRRVVVLTVDPARRLADALGVALGPTPTPVPLDAPGTLHALMLDQKHAFDDALERLHPDAGLVERLRENRYYRAVSERLAGAPEYMALEALHGLVSAGRWDVVVVDTPPASDALDVFRAPDRIAGIFGRSVLWVLLRPRARLIRALSRGGAATLRSLVGATVIDDIADFFRLFAGLVPAFTAHAAQVGALLASSRAQTLLVIDASAPDRADAVAFHDALREIGPRFGGFVVNRVVVDPGVADGPREVPAPPGVDVAAWQRVVDAVVAAAAGERREAAAHQALMARLAADGSAVWAVPRLGDAPGTLDGLVALGAGLVEAPPDAR